MCNCGCNRGFFGLDDQTLILILIFWLFFCHGNSICGCSNCGCGNTRNMGCGCDNDCGCGC